MAVVTCDSEGRIRAFDQGAQEMFGYRPEEVIGKKRFRALAPGMVAIRSLDGWLAQARKDGAFETVTALRRGDGKSFSARLVLRSLADGFEGEATAMPEMPLEKALPAPGLPGKIAAFVTVTRAPFLTATLAPVVLGGAWAWERGLAKPFPVLLFAAALLAATLIQIAANMLNDYFDWQSGADQLNSDFFAPFSGGSRGIELGLLSASGTLAWGLAALGVSAILGIGMAIARGWGLVAFGAAGAFAAWAYTAPPLRLAARKGIGELTVGVCFGPLLVAGTVFALTGALAPEALVAGIPLGTLTLAILWINEIPDAPSDKAAGKTNLVVVLGPRGAAIGYAILVAIAFLAIGAGVLLKMLPIHALGALVLAPLGVRTSMIALAHHSDRSLVRANAGTIQLNLLVGIALTLACVVHGLRPG
jgi:1,4-dihydroxy-2-naphthoate polyprenyltransferase